jgi:hypothetical protein
MAGRVAEVWLHTREFSGVGYGKRFFSVAGILPGRVAHECSQAGQKNNCSPSCSCVRTVREDLQDGHGGGRTGDGRSLDTGSLSNRDGLCLGETVARRFSR